MTSSERRVLKSDFDIALNIINMASNEKVSNTKLFVSSKQTTLLFGLLHPRSYANSEPKQCNTVKNDNLV